MSEKEQLYQETIKRQSEAALTYLAERIHEENIKRYEEIEEQSRDCEIPAETQAKILQMIRQEKRESLYRKRKRRIKKIVKACVILLLVMITTGVVLISTVDAFKYRFEQLFMQWKPQYFNLTPEESAEPAGWYPDYLPEGFAFDTVRQKEDVSILVFCNANGDLIQFEYQFAAGTNIYLDNEVEQSGKLKVNQEYDGIWTENQGTVILLWMRDDQIMRLISRLDLEEQKRIAESMEFKK